MNKKIFLPLIFSLCLSLQVFGQVCLNSSYEPGTLLLNGEEEVGALCFKRLPDPNPINNMYHTNYTFKVNGNKETYQLDFYFFRLLDSVSIVYFNEQTGYRDTNHTKLDRKGSMWMVKNYKANDTLINRSENYPILFTIPDIDKPHITLNQFQLPDDKTKAFAVSVINTLLLKIHIAESKLYHLLNKSESAAARERRKKKIEGLFREMTNYKDSMIGQLKTEERAFSDRERPQEADSNLADEFTRQLNSIFINYYKNVFKYKDYNSRIEFVFICDKNGKIDSAKEIRFINSEQIKWFEDSFKRRVMPDIANRSYKNLTRTNWQSLGLYKEFNEKFLCRLNNLSPDRDDMSEFEKISMNANKDFEQYETKEINISTKYTYTLIYQSTVKYETWVYQIATSKKPAVFGPMDSNEQISEELKNKFRRDIAGERKGKYDVKRCDVIINNDLKGQDIQPIK